jgi:group II intron reverse transcriptase/maturase
MNWEELDKNLIPNLSILWNRLTSGSYFPQPVKETEIEKKDGGIRKLGIPTILDRIAQQVVKTHLERIVEPLFSNNSFGYRPGRNCHQAVEKAHRNTFGHDWAIDLDIKSFFDKIDHDLLMKAVRHYCKDKWVLMYTERWLKAGTFQSDGNYIDRLTGTPQGGVISPLMANIFLHVVFDKWMEQNHPEKPFVRYADDIVIHCKTEKQTLYMLSLIQKRLSECKLSVNAQKTRIVNLCGITTNKYPRSLDFLGFSLHPWWIKTGKGHRVMITTFISAKSVSKALDKFGRLKFHKWRKSIEVVAAELNPIIRGIKNYYCKFWTGHTHYLWWQLNERLLKWVQWEKGLNKKAALRWLRKKYRESPRLFSHWELVYP